MNRHSSSNLSDNAWMNINVNTNKSSNSIKNASTIKNSNRNYNSNMDNSEKENPYNNVYQVNTNAMLKTTEVGNTKNSPPSSLKNYWNYYLPALKGQSSSPVVPPGKPFGKLPIGGRRTMKKVKRRATRKQKNRK